jgi:hypothetical protein
MAGRTGVDFCTVVENRAAIVRGGVPARAPFDRFDERLSASVPVFDKLVWFWSRKATKNSTGSVD